MKLFKNFEVFKSDIASVTSVTSTIASQFQLDQRKIMLHDLNIEKRHGIDNTIFIKIRGLITLLSTIIYGCYVMYVNYVLFRTYKLL